MRTRTTEVLTMLIVMITSLPVLAQTAPNRPGYGHYGWDWGWGWGHMILGPAMMLLFWGGLIVLIVFAVRWFSSAPSPGFQSPQSQKRALDILEESFARGEIDQSEFESRKRQLSD